MYKNFTRMHPSDFDLLINLIRPKICKKKDTVFRETIPVQERLAVTNLSWTGIALTLRFWQLETHTSVFNTSSKYRSWEATAWCNASTSRLAPLHCVSSLWCDGERPPSERTSRCVSPYQHFATEWWHGVPSTLIRYGDTQLVWTRLKNETEVKQDLSNPASTSHFQIYHSQTSHYAPPNAT
jgi:hypothetical protein